MMSLGTNCRGRAPCITGRAIVVVVGFLATIIVDGASGEYDSGGVQKFAGQTVDGNGNGLCSGANCAERGSAISGAMWFGPRLGRRRRSGEKTETYDDEQINAIADAIEGAPWTVVSIQGGKRHTNPFTPRLGRESGEELIQKYLLMADNSRLARLMEGQDDMDQRQSPPPPPPPFAPRLGRRLPFAPSPRLGRRLRALLQKL